MQDVFERYGLTYVTGSLPQQVASAWHKVVRLSLPNDFEKAPLATVTALTTKQGRRELRRRPAA